MELAGYREEQIEALLYHYPNMTTILEMAQKQIAVFMRRLHIILTF